MDLLLDMGNQRVKWRLVNAATETTFVSPQGVFDVSQLTMPSPVNLFGSEFNTKNSLDAVWISSVSSGAATAAIIAYCGSRFGLEPQFVSTNDAACGLENGYERPAQLGVDRWLAALAGWHKVVDDPDYEGAIVVDAGTAVTVDLVLGNRFCGGAILPGLGLAIRTLGSDTGKIRLESTLANPADRTHHKNMEITLHQVDPTIMPGTNSDDAVAAGAFAAVCGGVACCIASFDAGCDTKRPLPVLVCGGDAGLVSGYLRSGDIGCSDGRDILLCPDLVLDGLALRVRSAETGANA